MKTTKEKLSELRLKAERWRRLGRVEGWTEAADYMERGWGSSIFADVLREARDAKYGKRPDRAKDGA